MRTSRISEGMKKRKMESARVLAKKFVKNSRSTEKCVLQDEKDFTLKVPLNPQSNRPYVNGSKNDVHNNRLFYQTNKLSKKVMV